MRVQCTTATLFPSLWRRRGLFTEPELHGLDLRLLVHDDLLRESPHHRIFAIKQLGLGHINRTLMVRNHHGAKIVVNVAIHRSRLHAIVHPLHTLFHDLHKTRRPRFRLSEGRDRKCSNQAGNPKALRRQNSCDAHLTPVPSQRIVAVNHARALIRPRGVCEQNGEASCGASLLRVLRFVQDSS